MTTTIGGQNYYYFVLPLKKQPEGELTTNAKDWWWIYMNDPCEDIYTLEDGEPIGDNHAI